MFAIMALAVVGFGITPAFATTVAASVQDTMTSGNNSSSEDSTACGTQGGHCFVQFDANTFNDSVTVHWGSHDGATCDKATVTLSGPGGPDSTFVWDMSGDNYVWTSFDLNVDVNDTITATVAYKDCD